ncbi:MAG: hypothetical protein LBC18_10745, partial [Opitutaceae bacterium]|nr:hypothetical protein [Opitutaceae bacterium]
MLHAAKERAMPEVKSARESAAVFEGTEAERNARQSAAGGEALRGEPGADAVAGRAAARQGSGPVAEGGIPILERGEAVDPRLVDPRPDDPLAGHYQRPVERDVGQAGRVMPVEPAPVRAGAGEIIVPGVGAETRPARPANRLGIKQGDNLTAEQRGAEERFADFLNSKTDEELDALYDALPDAQGGRMLNTDVMRELSPDYVRDPQTHAPSTHEGASAYIHRRYLRELEKKQDSTPVVEFMAGGPGSGKSTAVTPTGHIVYDRTLSNFDDAVSDIEAALKTGRAVRISYVHTPVEKAVELAAKRKRRVPTEYLGKSHHDAQDTIIRLAEKYKDNPDVKIRVTDN